MQACLPVGGLLAPPSRRTSSRVPGETMERKDRIDALGAVLLVAFAMVMGLGQVFIKLVNAEMGPVFQAGLRSACAFPVVLGFALIARKRLSLTDGSLGPGILCGCFFAVEFLLLYTALDYTTVSRAAVLFYTMPVWVALWAHFLIPGEQMSRARALGLVLAVGGVALALLRNDNPATERALTGDLMALGGAMCWAGIPYFARMTRLSRASPEMQLLYQLAVSAVILTGAALVFGPLLGQMTPGLWAMFGFQVVVVVGIGFLMWFWILKHYPASDMASFGFLAPLSAVLFGWLILGETITWTIAAALAMVGAGIMLVNRRGRRR
jgi:drug/metabolite transporter (DMT)-like permease